MCLSKAQATRAAYCSMRLLIAQHKVTGVWYAKQHEDAYGRDYDCVCPLLTLRHALFCLRRPLQLAQFWILVVCLVCANVPQINSRRYSFNMVLRSADKRKFCDGGTLPS